MCILLCLTFALYIFSFVIWASRIACIWVKSMVSDASTFFISHPDVSVFDVIMVELFCMADPSVQVKRKQAGGFQRKEFSEGYEMRSLHG